MNSNDEQVYTLDEVLGNINKEIIIVSKLKKWLDKCSYENGYITQEVYICKTCYKENGKMAGLCGACAFKCHEDHEIEELNFKRNFRCDCGNSNYCKISKLDIHCSYGIDKDVVNENTYGHNFEGKYCYCNNSDDGDMIQCLSCEDWFHFEHVDVKVLFNYISLGMMVSLFVNYV